MKKVVARMDNSCIFYRVSCIVRGPSLMLVSYHNKVVFHLPTTLTDESYALYSDLHCIQIKSRNVGGGNFLSIITLEIVV